MKTRRHSYSYSYCQSGVAICRDLSLACGFRSELLDHCCIEHAIQSLFMTGIRVHGRIRHSETRIVPCRTPHQSEPDVFQDRAVMATRRRDR